MNQPILKTEAPSLAQPEELRSARVLSSGEISDLGLNKKVPSDFPAYHAAVSAGDVLGSGIENGIPTPSHLLTDNGLVTVQGVQMKVGDAVRYGFLTKTPNGLAVPQQEQPKAPEPIKLSPEQTGIYEPEPFADAEDQKAHDEIAQTIPAHFLDVIANEMTTGGVTEDTAKKIASAVPGLQPEDALRMVDRATDLFGRQAGEVFTSHGLNPEAFAALAWQKMPDLMAQAVKLHVTQRSTEGYKSLLKSYTENLDKHNPTAALNTKVPGVTIAKENGQVIVRTSRGSFRWGEAVRAGVIKVGGK